VDSLAANPATAIRFGQFGDINHDCLLSLHIGVG
jgi:hypothetical protein